MTSDDQHIADALRAAPLPPTPILESRVSRLIRRRRARRVVLAATPVLALALLFTVWRPWAEPSAVDPTGPIAGNEIAPEDLAVLFAPPPVDELTVLAARNDGSVAALRRLEGPK